MRIDLRTRRPILHNNMGGFSGAAVFPVAVRMVYQVSRAVQIPVIGMGGIASGNDAIEMMLAGASAVAVGTMTFHEPAAMSRIIAEMADYAERHGIGQISELIGAVQG